MNILLWEHGHWSDTGRDSYQADVFVWDGTIAQYRGSTWPNPADPDAWGRKREAAYGCLDVGRYWWEYSDTAHNGQPGIAIALNGPLVALTNNPNQEGRQYVDHIDLHSGSTATWRGSAGCPTIHPQDWGVFLNQVQGQQGLLILIRDQNVIA